MDKQRNLAGTRFETNGAMGAAQRRIWRIWRPQEKVYRNASKHRSQDLKPL